MPPVYLDNAATTRPHPQVVEVITQSLREGFYNPSAAYRQAMDAEKQMDRCRKALLESLRMPTGEVVFTSGGTEANALALLGRASRSGQKLRILTTGIEHPAVEQNLIFLAQMGHEIEEIPLDRQGLPLWAALESLLERPVDMLCMMQVNNETGTVLPLEAVSRRVLGLYPKAWIHVDGVQGFLRLTPLPRDCYTSYALSAHKIHGPKGIGALVVRKGAALSAQLLGGGQEKGLRSGTENTSGIAGLWAAVQMMGERAEEIEGMRRLKVSLFEQLKAAIPTVVCNGPPPESSESAPHILNVSFPGIRGEVMLHALEGAGILVSTGSACSSRRRKENRVLAAMGLGADLQEGAIRYSLCPDTTAQMIDLAAQASIAQYDMLKEMRRR